ncbi:TetR/AcrR family transcriptional regulator [Candidatus Solincola sp.]|nr:TetR/AcrR family transcriptional regulator [Actinomycetota bacterium]MDI7252860.1 TetR/AcrR family transcriptional regulator [Actinomycetota bacterium]
MPRRDKRADIVSAGIRVFSRKGFSRCSVEDILQEAHVARATFYSYFDSKKDLFVELVDGILNTMEEMVKRNLEEMPTDLQELQERTKRTILDLFEYFSQNLEFASIYIQEVMGMNPEIDARVIEWQRRMAELIAQLIQRGIDQGLFRKVDAYVIGNLISGATQHLGLNMFMFNQRLNPEKTAEAIADYLIYGLAAR